MQETASRTTGRQDAAFDRVELADLSQHKLLGNHTLYAAPDPFRALASSLLHVPKAAVDKEEAKYQKARKKLPKHGKP